MISNLHVLSTLTLTAHWLIVVLLSLRVILRRLPVGVSLAWLSVILSVPFMGAVAYLFFGEKHLGRRREAREVAVFYKAEKGTGLLRDGGEEVLPPTGSSGEPIYKYLREMSGFPALYHNRIEILDSFQSIFDSIIRDINNAERICCLGFYIWQEDGRTDEVIAALQRARRRGVTCRILADAIGSKQFFKDRSIKYLRNAGVEIVVALSPSIRRRADLRYHRKLIIIDDRIGYTGSQNMVDPRFFKRSTGVGQWIDSMIRIEGPSVMLLSDVFRVDWSVESDTPFEQREQLLNNYKDTDNDKGALVQVVPSGPVLRPHVIYELILTAIYSARKEITLTTPYFVPDESVITALLSAAMRGVAITVILPSQNDSFLVRHASIANFDKIIESGGRIALFNGGLLHTKSIVIDGEVSLFGSVNLDMRSLWLNYEISLVIYGAEFASRLKALHDSYLRQSTMADINIWRDRPLYLRLVDDVIRLFGPLL